MIVKTNLHLHTSDEINEFVSYNFFQAINEARKLKFGAIALTCHDLFPQEIKKYKKYAEERGILFIPGIEKKIEKKHVLILNPDPLIKEVKTFKELKRYKKNRPDIFIVAPHPYMPGGISLKNDLEKNVSLFDAVEHSWFYSKKINFNRKAEKISRKFNLPLIATSDTHELKFLNTNHALIEAESKSITAIFDAIRNNKFTNVTSPRKLFSEMVKTLLVRVIKNIIYKTLPLQKTSPKLIPEKQQARQEYRTQK